MALSGKQRAYLRGLGQDEQPAIFIGKAGITPPLRVELEDALRARELVKCRVQPSAPVAPAAAAEALARDSRAEIVGIAGRNFLLFRRSSEDPRLELPD